MQAIEQDPALSPSWFQRIDKGVIVEYVFHHRNNCTVRLFHGHAQECSICAPGYCRDKQAAEELEEAYREKHRDQSIGACFFCGRKAKIWGGLALCPVCM